MSMFQQIAAVTGMNVRSLPQRVGTSIVTVIGVAGVVAVLISVLAMATGLSTTITQAGSPDRAIVLKNGNSGEEGSNLARDSLMVVAEAPGVRRGSDGKPLASPELMTALDIARARDGTPSSVVIRGVTPAAFAVRPNFRLIEGRMPQPGVLEIIAGKAARQQFKGLAVGDKVRYRGNELSVVGTFESGDVHESSVFTDLETLNSALNRNAYSSITVTLESPEAFARFKDALTSDPRLSVNVLRETAFYEGQSQGLASLLYLVSNVVGGIMAVGALFGALNTMYSAVSERTVEIATLRAIGFGASGVVVSVMVEALILALLGALIGAGIAWLLFNGNVITSVGQGHQVVFKMTVAPALMVLGVAWACAIGLLGGLFPAWRAARAPVATALRAT